MKKDRILPLVFCVLLTASLLSGCKPGIAAGGPTPAASSPAGVTTPGGGASPSILVPQTEPLTDRRPTQPKTYDEVYKALTDAVQNAAANRNYATGTGSAQAPLGGPVPSTAQAPAAESGALKSDTAQNGSTAPAGYSQTNVQVQGVDEGDIVKTDGRNIYVLRQNELIILKADGASTKKLSSLKVIPTGKLPETSAAKTPEMSAAKAPDMGGYSNETATDLYVSGNTVVVISTSYGAVPYVTSGGDAKSAVMPVQNKQIAHAYLIDVTDASKPALKASFGQDGNVLSSRLIGKTLYLISNYPVYTVQKGDTKAATPESYIPNLYTESTATPVPAGSIVIAPRLDTTAYTVICAYDLAGAGLLASESLLGGGTTVYMNTNALYIARSTNEQKDGQPYTDSVYTVVERTRSTVTDITSFDLSGGGLKLKASGSVPGSLQSQFALDEWGGSLRVVTTMSSQSWTEYTDKAKGFINYVWKTPVSANALFVLNGALKAAGSVGSLAPGEQVQSVRFDGAIGYVVTFKRVDPLFAIDLSDPAKPVVLSALKIPGFSQYLHVYGAGRLFGLGMDADENTGRTTGMKLAMFDTTNPSDVTVKNSLKLSTSWSTALTNHKAILISPEKNLIAFPADSGYDIYGYSDAQGFVKRATIASMKWSGASRGLYIGDIAYIVDQNAVTVLDMSDFKLVNRITF